MGLRGPKPKGKVRIKWSSDFAYAIGLIVSDGCLYKTGRHICFTSKDKEQINNFQKALGLKILIGTNHSGYKDKTAFRVQFSDMYFWNFLNEIGVHPCKSKTIDHVNISDKYFFDFLRGVFDGDGSIYSYFDKRWRSSFLFYISFSSASYKFILWLQKNIKFKLDIVGHIDNSKNTSCFQLKYAKKEALVLINSMYKKNTKLFLSRKKLKIESILDTMHGNIDKYLDLRDRYYS